MSDEFIPYTDIEYGTPEAAAYMRECLETFISAGYKLLHAWDERLVNNYPASAPSFDELLAGLSGMMDER